MENFVDGKELTVMITTVVTVSIKGNPVTEIKVTEMGETVISRSQADLRS